MLRKYVGYKLMYDMREKQMQEIEESIQKILTNKKTRKKFKELIEESNIPLTIPETPLDNIERELEERLSKIEFEKEREEIMKLLNEYGIGPSEYNDLIEFQKTYRIADNKKAIELYAQMRARQIELEPVRLSFKSSLEGWSKEEAYKKTIEELRK